MSARPWYAPVGFPLPPTDAELGYGHEPPGCDCGHPLTTHLIDPDGHCSACTCTLYREDPA